MSHVFSLTDLATWSKGNPLGGVTLCHGCFDFLHVGHIRHFQSARRLGWPIVVTVTPDQFVNKGPRRPFFPESLRAEAIAALECVSAVAINEWPTAVETLKLLRPKIYCKGPESKEDCSPGFLAEKEAAYSIGTEVHFTNDVVFSSTRIIETLSMLRQSNEELRRG